MKRVFFIAALLVSVTAFAQNSINNYKYVIVPKQFEFVSSADKYQTSSLTEFLFNKSGFTAFLSDEALPDDLARNRCLALTAKVVDDSSLFTTKTTIELRNCNNQVLYTSAVGESKNKDYKKAYHESIRNAFKSINRLKYKYVPNGTTVNQSVKNPVKKDIAVLQVPTTPTRVPSKNTGIKNPRPTKTITANELPNSNMNTSTSTAQVLYAQPKGNGYQLVNTTPTVVFQILPLRAKNFYVIKDKNGVLFQKGNMWIAEYYKNGQRVVETYQIKF